MIAGMTDRERASGQGRPRLVVLSGAGISAESGLRTFRGADGLWEGYRIEDVATPEAFEADPEQVLAFYNLRREQLAGAAPNAGHTALARLESAYDVRVVTQNIDDLHERGGSRNVLHLHGELTKARSSRDPSLVRDIGYGRIEPGDVAEDGAQLRPHVVWFGEMVPALPEAAELVRGARVLLVVGTSLAVYPAAGLVHDAPPGCRRFYVDPSPDAAAGLPGFECLAENAATGVPKLVERLLAEAEG